ncbi:MAG: ECF transporter S component [Oscillospiraceae bacterium]
MSNNTAAQKPAKRLVLSAVFTALGLALPFITGGIPLVGNMLLPMHLSVLLCGFACGGGWGLAVGFILPLLRSALFSMPPMWTAVPMAFELAAYGFVTGALSKRLPQNLAGTYIALIAAMLAGRLVWGIVRFIMTLWGTEFSFALFLSGAFVTALPGIVAQLILIPLLVAFFRRARLV